MAMYIFGIVAVFYHIFPLLGVHCTKKIWQPRQKVIVFLENQCYDHIFQKLAAVLAKKNRQLFRRIFWRKRS
jgi:hypothetical protein